MTLTTDATSMSNPDNNEGAAAVTEAESLLRKNADEKALLVGLDPGEVRVQEIDWPSLLKAALAVKVHVYGSGFEVSLSPEDFGIAPESDEERQAWNRNLKLGKIGTLPEKIRRESMALKGRLVTHTGRYVNETNFGDLIKLGDADPERNREQGWIFAEWLNGARKIAKEYNDLAQRIYDDWDTIMAEMRAEYRLIGIGVYARLKAMNKAGLGTLEEEVDRFVNQRMAKIVHERESVKPVRNEKGDVVAGMRMSWEVTDIPLAAQLAQDQSDAAKILADSAELRSQQRVMWEIEQEKIRTARDQIKEGAKTLIADLRANTNTMLYRVSLNVLKAIQDNGEVPGGSVKGLRNLVDNIQHLALLPDAQVDAHVTEIRRLLKQASMNDQIEETQSVMKRICVEAKLVLKELDRSTVSSREVGVPDTLAGLQRVAGLERRSNGQQRTLDMTPALPSASAETVTQRAGERDI